MVALALLFSSSWIRRLGETSPNGPFQPPPGHYHQEVIDDDGSHVLVPLEIAVLGDGRYELRMPWRPPEPAIQPMPAQLAAQKDLIPLRIRLAATGDVEDVVGPDDHFDRVDASDPEAADQLRCLLLEEQWDAALGWQLTAWMRQPLVAGTTFSADAALRGYGGVGDWRGTIDYSAGAEVPCPPAAGDEPCAVVSFSSRPENDGRIELSGRLLVGASTRVEWQATLRRDAGERRREVTRRLLPVDH